MGKIVRMLFAGGRAGDDRQLVELRPEELLPADRPATTSSIPAIALDETRGDLENRILQLEAQRDQHLSEIAFHRARLAEMDDALEVLRAAYAAMTQAERDQMAGLGDGGN